MNLNGSGLIVDTRYKDDEHVGLSTDADMDDLPVGVAAEDGAVRVEQSGRDNDDLGHLARLVHLRLARHLLCPQLGRSVRRQHNLLAPVMRPVGVQIEARHVERRALLLQRLVRAPDLEDRLHLEERGRVLLRGRLDLLARHAHRVWAQFARNCEVGGFGPQEVVDDRP